MPTLTRRRSPDAREEAWRIFYGDVRVGTIAKRVGSRTISRDGVGAVASRRVEGRTQIYTASMGFAHSARNAELAREIHRRDVAILVPRLGGGKCREGTSAAQDLQCLPIEYAVAG